ncbi:hypothetical protein P170DRAFT_251546 [Aspergillus steynii IBT 23096]|uniref:Uncharacterized protein n=1 Tax=Aspergillus steynii IBT 23096 TaxID=1392250 RepID=A0A2I2FYQ8_9EURO|nr:uncharacterized protein P170DRAFT_251546 [Aspergillus steynii IBT 23096]PLB45757.1 hypothetical protein P170DRAFT_251546 [Aspergillus steynii IBT 23096]
MSESLSAVDLTCAVHFFPVWFSISFSFFGWPQSPLYPGFNSRSYPGSPIGGVFFRIAVGGLCVISW